MHNEMEVANEQTDISSLDSADAQGLAMPLV